MPREGVFFAAFQQERVSLREAGCACFFRGVGKGGDGAVRKNAAQKDEFLRSGAFHALSSEKTSFMLLL